MPQSAHLPTGIPTDISSNFGECIGPDMHAGAVETYLIGTGGAGSGDGRLPVTSAGGIDGGWPCSSIGQGTGLAG